jgi:hydroxypyruvate isomerase
MEASAAMPEVAANIDWLFCELPFMERFEEAARAGFQAVEFLFPYSCPAVAIGDLLHCHGLTNVLFNLPPGDWASGERGIAALPGRELEFRNSVELALSYASMLKTRQLHVLPGIVPPGVERAACVDTYLQNLIYAADKATSHGITLLVEAINPTDMPNYLVQTQAESSAVCAAPGTSNVRMQLDLYHMQMTEGGLADALRRYRTLYSHVQIAGAPARHEPDVGIIDYPPLFDLLDELGYEGWAGCEYKPIENTLDGLGWYRKQRR